MPKRQGPARVEKESLVPAVEKEEGQLQAFLEQARAEARLIVENAEREAWEKKRRGIEELPGVMARRRAEMLESHRGEAERLRAELAAETRRVVDAAQGNLERAVSFIVSLVWPGDGGGERGRRP